jgi:hypothetical protein
MMPAFAGRNEACRERWGSAFNAIWLAQWIITLFATNNAGRIIFSRVWGGGYAAPNTGKKGSYLIALV